MDIADDITYAIHDLEDFYLSGLLDSSLVVEELRHLVSEKPPQSPSPIEKLESSLSQNNVEYYDHSMFLEAADYVRSKLTDEFPRLTSPKVEPTVRQATSDLIGRYILAVKLSEQPLWAGGPHLSVDRRQWHELQIFKAITMNYVISRSDIAVIQRGQAAALKTLAGLLDKWINDSKDRRRAPRRLQDLYALAQTEEERKRCVLDYLCSLTDLQCLSLLDALLGSRAPRVGLPFM
jgi:dGTPase